ncbi:polymer-forming cytoskeletal protein [Melaminivora sp.]|uniref:bactofilin family protein n=1 Tax=Melaminivora sp. TaxID=1933032 RepID=UPI0028AD8704|nr:polymer-forming cytoskeletal protein [Melaminivora sp.]
MAVQNPFFGRRDSSSNLTPGSSPANPLNRPGEGLAGRQMPGASSLGAGSSVGSVRTEPQVAAAEAPASAADATAPAGQGGGSKLTVGPNIKLKGVEITDCDTLVVEGTVEATMDSRVIHIAEQGAFKGCAEIDIAEIHGRFDGQLTVREKLVIFGSGRVSGKIRYGKVVIEEGGQLTGEISTGGARGEDAAPAPAAESPVRRPATTAEPVPA